jgi:hypothetical protein
MPVAEIGISMFLDGQVGCGDCRLQQFLVYGLWPWLVTCKYSKNKTSGRNAVYVIGR